MAIGEIIEDFAAPLTLRRRASGGYAMGRFLEGAATDVTIRAVVVPSTGRDLNRVPEGLRTRVSVRVFSQSELRVGPPPDEFVYGGETYQLVHVAPWTQGEFYDAMAVKTQDPTTVP